MSSIPIFLADAELQEVLASWRINDAATREHLAIFTAIGLVTVLLLIWVIFVRKKRRRQHAHHHSSRSAVALETSRDEDSPSRSGKRRRRRRSGRKHRPRNPTLAETGGLPPPRPDFPAEPQL